MMNYRYERQMYDMVVQKSYAQTLANSVVYDRTTCTTEKYTLYRA